MKYDTKQGGGLCSRKKYYLCYMEQIMARITMNPVVCNGKPTIRNMRFTVAQMLELLAAGMTPSEILNDYPYIEEEDINACLLFASKMANPSTIIPAA